MKKVLALVLAASMLAGIGYTNTGVIKAYADEVVTVESGDAKLENLIKNGDFSDGLTKWGTYTESGGDFDLSCEDGELKAKISSVGEVAHGVQVSQNNFPLYKGGKYRLTFDISSTIERYIYYCVQMNGGDYHAYFGDQATIGPDKKTISVEFTMNEDTDLAPSLGFNMGNLSGELEEHTVTIDNVSLVLIDGSGIDESEIKGEKEEPIVLNQLGYLPNDSKKVVFRGADLADKSFNIVNVETNEVVYTGEISEGKYNKNADEINYFGDFSDLTEVGTYKVITESLGESYEFKIGKDVYKEALKDAVKFFYMQRCGEELPEEYAGAWAHPACHTSLARVYGTDKMIDVSGGWHDAGDYGRYVVATSKAVADLMLAYQADRTAFGDDTNIPESGNGVADILDEVKGQLQWMFKMQNDENGGVYHKVTCATFPGYIMPEEETDELIVCPETTTATGDFAAVMAMGYEEFKHIDKEFADKCLAAAEKAWDYLDAQPSSTVSNPKGIVTGAYEDSSDRDERYWAAAQLFKATGNEKYNKKIKDYVSEKIEMDYGWQTVGNYGNQAYLKAKGADESTCNKIKKAMIKEADKIVEASKEDSYGVANGAEYYWGSNMGILDQASLLEFVNKLSANPEYDEYAKEHINYCFGKNANAISFVSGYGTVSTQKPHHRPSIAVGKAVPGMLAGGVNAKLEDPYAEAYLYGKAPAKCYLDNEESYSTNEVDIYWNSPLVRALAETKAASDEKYSNEDITVTASTNNDANKGIKQEFTIANNKDEAIDLSKVAIRYYYSKSDDADMDFYVYHAGIDMNKTPWYTNFNSDVNGTFGSDENGNYVEIKINNPFELESDMQPLKLKTCIANKHWTTISDFKYNGIVVLYDGKIVK